MQTRKLQHAVTLARMLNFTRAAQALNITQSALSRSIQSLEADCGLQLFDRGRGAVAVTQAGREFVRHAESLLRSEAALRNFAAHTAHGAGGQITLGVTPLAARVLLAPVLAQRLAQPQFQAEVIVASTRSLTRMVAQESLDLAIGGELAVANPALRGEELARFTMAMIVRRDHPLTRLARVSEADAQTYPFIRPTSFRAEEVLPVRPGPGGSAPPALSVEDYGVLEQIVRMTDAIWPTSPLAARDGIARGELVALPMTWRQDTPTALLAYTLAGRTLSPLTTAMLEEFRALGAQCSLHGGP